jgi:hypothetical protein
VLHHLRKSAAHLGHRVREPMGVDFSGAPVGEHEHRVVRRSAAIDAEAVEGLRDGVGQRPLQRRWIDQRIVVSTASMVAIAGDNIAAPFAIPPIVKPLPATASLLTVSVVRIARAASAPPLVVT